MFGLRYNLSKDEGGHRRRKKQGGEYRHIRIEDKIDAVRKIRRVTVECPLEYPGLTESERRRMYEGLAMVADAFREADARCRDNHYNRMYKS